MPQSAPRPPLPQFHDNLSDAGFPFNEFTVLSGGSDGGGSKRWVAATDTGFVIRCTRTDSKLVQPAENELGWAQRIGEQVAAQRPLHPNPIRFDGWTITIWENLERVRPVGVEDAFEHGRILRRLHDNVTLTSAEEVQGNDQLTAAKRRIEHVAAGNPSLGWVLRSFVNDAEQYLALEAELPNVAAHGDSLNHNLLVTDRGLVLIDFDAAAPGPRTVDLATGVLSYRHHLKDEAAAQKFLTGYGDIRFDPDLLEKVIWVKRFRQACTHAYRGDDVSGRVDELRSAQKQLA